MNETQKTNVPKVPQGLQSQASYSPSLIEHMAVDPTASLPLGEWQDWPEQIAMGTLTPYPSPLAFRNYFAQQCGSLGTFAALESNNQAKTRQIGSRITILLKNISKMFPRSLHRLVLNTASPCSMDQNWGRKSEKPHTIFEAGQKGSLARAQESSSWCEILKELMLMWQALHSSCDHIKQKGKKLNATGPSVHTITIESFLQTGIHRNSESNSTAGASPISPSPLNPRKKDREFHWDELISYFLVARKNKNILPKWASQCEYIYVNQQDFNEYMLEKSSQATQQKYQDLLKRFQDCNKESTDLLRKYCLIITLTNDALIPGITNFCNEISLGSKHYCWKSQPFMYIYEIYLQLQEIQEKAHQSLELNPESQKDPPKGKKEKDSSLQKFRQALKPVLEEIFAKMTETFETSVDTTITTFKRPTAQISNSAPLANDQNQEAIQKSSLESAQQKLTQEISQVEQLQKKVTAKSETFLEETDRLITETQKRMSLLQFWKEIMVQCKYRCRLGYKCPCQLNQRNLQSEQKYLDKLLRYRDRIIPADQKKPQLAIESQTAVPAAAASAKQKQNNGLQPSKTEDKQAVVSEVMGTGSGRKDEKKKRHLCGHGSGRQTENKKIRLKRGLRDYGEQELNLLNLLDQMDFDELHRTPCYVEESRVSRWKQMGDKYKKSSQKKVEAI